MFDQNKIKYGITEAAKIYNNHIDGAILKTQSALGKLHMAIKFTPISDPSKESDKWNKFYEAAKIAIPHVNKEIKAALDLLEKNLKVPEIISRQVAHPTNKLLDFEENYWYTQPDKSYFVSDAQKNTNVIFQMMNSRFKDFL